ncbi:MAG TPA: CBS domain-containing protein [Methanomicrobiales archaeon]|nr:CBS domain-containing protein [Methanomicrobiales archaeon]
MTRKRPTIQFETRVPLSEVMRYPPTTIGSDATVADAALAMCREKVGSCIVLENNFPIGIITEEDINCKVVVRDQKPSEVYVKEAMSSPLITISSGKSVGDAAKMMVKHKVRRLPVVEGQKVVGVVTVRDILSVASAMEEILAELIDVNREEVIEMGVCDRCGSMSDDLRRSDNLMLCPACRTEDLLV